MGRLDDVLGVQAVKGRLGCGVRERTLPARAQLRNEVGARARALTMASAGSTGTTFSVWLDTGPPHCGQPSHCSSTYSACWSPVDSDATVDVDASSAQGEARQPSSRQWRANARQRQHTRRAAAVRRAQLRNGGGVHAQKQWPHGATLRVPLRGSQQTLHLDIPGGERK